MMAALDVGEHEAGVERERVGPRRDDAEVAPLALVLAEQARAARDRLVVTDAQGGQAFVEAVRRILEHLGLPSEPPRLAPARAPPELEFAFEA